MIPVPRYPSRLCQHMPWQQTQQAICCQNLHLSLGPALMWASLTLMRKLAVEFQN
jgi:hypothetical protein